MIKTIKKKIKCSKNGFTLTEMLCVIIIVVLVSSCLTLGINLCKDSLQKITTFSKTQMLSSTLTSTISDELRYAEDITQSGSTVLYTSDRHGTNSRIMSNSQGQIVLTSDIDKDEYPLVASSAYFGSKITEDNFSISYDPETKYFTVEFTIETKNNITKTTTFMVEALNGKEISHTS